MIKRIVRWLHDELRDGPQTAGHLKRRGEEDGLSWRMILRAAKHAYIIRPVKSRDHDLWRLMGNARKKSFTPLRPLDESSDD